MSEWDDAFKGGEGGMTLHAPDVRLRATGGVLGVHVENDRNDPDFVLIAVNLRVRRRDLETEDQRNGPAVRRDPTNGRTRTLGGGWRSDLSSLLSGDVITPSARAVLLPDSLVDRERIAREVEAERLRAEALNAVPLPDPLASALAKHGAPVRS